MNAYMLQETHFTKENENIIEAEWGFKCICLQLTPYNQYFIKSYDYSIDTL
jgi:hypothetical protein